MEAVGRYRALADANPDAFLHGLVASLSNLSDCLAERGEKRGARRCPKGGVASESDIPVPIRAIWGLWRRPWLGHLVSPPPRAFPERTLRR